MKIYTKRATQEIPGCSAGRAVAQDAPRIEAYGTVDELNAVLGMARADALTSDVDLLLARVQNELFDLGAELATPDAQAKKTATLGANHIKALESAIDRHESQLAPLKQFILPGGTQAAALLHVARTVCRAPSGA